MPFYYDGHQQLKGVFGGSPDSVPPNFAHQAVNRFFREDYNRTRPSIHNIELEFESDEQKTWFHGANGQGATFYNGYPSFVTSKLIASIGGRIFSIEVNGRKGVVKMLIDGNSRQFMHSWFVQGFEWLVIQDGIHTPFFWDGKNEPVRSNLAKNEMPIGSVMAFIHGRFVVASADGKNSIFVGDIAYGGTLTSPKDILSFTEQTYWAEGGSFGTPVFLGDIMGLYPMPYLDVGTGQNELVIGCTNGFSSLDLSAPREQWINQQVQRVALIGTGLSSSHGFAGLNGDMFYRSQSGIASYRNSRVEYSQHWNQTPVSREVNYWIKPDRKDYLEFVPMVSWQNMVITGCSPLISNPTNSSFGKHRYCRGMTVFDADAMSTAGRDGSPVWHGMWSGIRPWAFAQGFIGNANRCFAFSYDKDGSNRLYEFTLTDTDDTFENQPRKIESNYTTSMFGNVEEVTNAFAPKIINGGVLEMSNIKGASNFTVEYRPDGSPCWVFVDKGAPGCDCPIRKDCDTDPNRSLTAAPQWARKYLQQVPSNQCVPGSSQPANVFHHCQVKVNVIGSFTVDRMNIRFEVRTDGQIAECMGNNCLPIDCCPAENDYAYSIAPTGDNGSIPYPPESPFTGFVGNRQYRACCRDYPSVCVIESGQGISMISQAEADLLAQDSARINANNSLVCPTCTRALLLDMIVVNGDVIDFSPFFIPSQYPQFAGQPFRIVNVLTVSEIATGLVGPTGTLSVSQVPAYAFGTYDPITHLYVDTGAGSERIQLQIGCNLGGAYTYDETPAYDYMFTSIAAMGDVVPNLPYTIVRITTAGSVGPDTLGAATVSMLELSLRTGTPSTITLPGQTIKTNIVSNTFSGDSFYIGAAASEGTLMSLAFSGTPDLELRNDLPLKTMVIASKITNNTVATTLTKSGGGVTELVGLNSYTGITVINDGTLRIGYGSTTGNLGTAAVTNNSILTFNRSDSITIANVISGVGSVTNGGTGTTTLSAVNTYTGATIVTTGGMIITGSITSNVTVLDASTFTAGAVTIAGTVTAEGATSTTTLTGTTTNSIFVTGGTLNINTVTAPSITMTSGSVIVTTLCTSPFTQSGGSTLLVAATFSSATLAISGGTFNASNSFVTSASITVTGGTVTSSAFGTWTTVDMIGGTFTGEGTAVSIVLHTGAILKPKGNLTISASLGIVAGATYSFEVDTDGFGCPTTALIGDLAIDPAAIFLPTETGTTSMTAITFQLITFTGVWNGVVFTGYPNNFIFAMGVNTYQINYNANDVSITGQ